MEGSRLIFMFQLLVATINAFNNAEVVDFIDAIIDMKLSCGPIVGSSVCRLTFFVCRLRFQRLSTAAYVHN